MHDARHPTDPPDPDLPQRLWRELDQAVHQRGHAWRTPVLATTDDQGLAQARTVVLRAVDPVTAQLHIYTDRRSPKVAELLAQPLATLVFWSAELQWQLRIAARFHVLAQGEAVDAAWQQVRHTASAADYLAPAPPGSDLTAHKPAEGKPATPHQLAVLVAQVESMDWLALARSGHQRVKWRAGRLTRLAP